MPSKVLEENSKYWEDRYAYLGDRLAMGADAYSKLAKEQFDDAYASIERALRKLYKKFGDSEGVSVSEAKRLLDKDELEEFRMTLEEYIALGESQNADYSEEVRKKLYRASAKYRVTRLEAVQTQLEFIADSAYSNIRSITAGAAGDSYKDAYYRSIYEIQRGFGVGASFSKVDRAFLDKLLKEPWVSDGSDFSDRVWNNKAKLIKNLPTVLTRSLALGQSYSAACRVMRSRMDTEYYKCARIITTEAAYFSSVGQKDSWEELGVDEYKIVATLDLVTSEICREMDGKVFSMDKYKVGATAPPFHPNCRTTTAPYFRDEDVPGYIEGTRAARDDETGETYRVPASMTYEDWYNEHVLGLPPKPKAAPIEIKVGKLDEFFNEDEIEEIKSIMRDAPENVRTLWNKHADHLVVKPLSPRDNPTDAYFSRADKAMHFRKEKITDAPNLDGKYPYETLFHESGHLFDFYSTNKKDGNPFAYLSGDGFDRTFNFASTLQREGEEMFHSWVRRHPPLTPTGKLSIKRDVSDEVKELKRKFDKGLIGVEELMSHDEVLQAALDYKGRSLIKEFQEELNIGFDNHQKHDISDMLEWILTLQGFGNQEYPLRYGHGTKYWFNPKGTENGKRKNINLYLNRNQHMDIRDLHEFSMGLAAKEAFAEMYSATVMGRESLELIKRFFPDSYDIFLKIVEEAIK